MTVYKMVEVQEVPYLYSERTCSMDPSDVSKNMEIAFAAVGAFVAQKGITSADKALSVYPMHDEKTLTFRAGFIVSAEDAAKAEGEIRADVLPAGRVLNYIHRGPYANLRVSYGEMMKYVDDNNMVLGLPNWEIYLNEPDSVASEDELETDIYVTVSEA